MQEEVVMEYDKQICTPEERRTYRLIGELTLLSALLFGGLLSTSRERPEFRAPLVVGECDRGKAHVNYNDQSTWCSPQKISIE